MPHSHRELFYHLIWSTKNRYPYISQSICQLLLDLIRDKAVGLGCQVSAANCMPDHIHVLLYIPPRLAVARIIRELKGFSSYGLRNHRPDFSWQEGYGAITLRRSDLPAVQAYIADQERHHNQTKQLDPMLEEIENDAPEE